MQTIGSPRQLFPFDVHLFSLAGSPATGPQATSASAPKQAEAPSRRAWLGAAICVVATVVSLAPFADKAFNTDDPLFLYAARQICLHPADPYGFKLNWYGSEMPMAEVATNPPLASYYIALVASCIG